MNVNATNSQSYFTNSKYDWNLGASTAKNAPIQAVTPMSSGETGMPANVKDIPHTPSTLSLHYFDSDEGDTAISCAGKPDGSSVTVYKTKGFDSDNPVYKVKYWDPEGNVSERMVDVSKVNPQDCDYIDMYAYSVYLSDSGKYDSAITDFMMSSNGGRVGEGPYTYEDLLEKQDWMGSINDWMQMQYDCGNYSGYLGYKNFYDYLIGELDNRGSESGKSVTNTRKDRTESDYDASQVNRMTEESAKAEVNKAAQDRMIDWYDELFKNTADGVRQAWDEAKEKVGADGSAFDKSGKLTHISQIIAERLTGNHTDNTSLLGSSLESAYAFAKRAADRIEDQLQMGHSSNEDAKNAKEAEKQEREFYLEFMNNLQGLMGRQV